MLRGYIGVLIGEIRGHRMSVPPALIFLVEILIFDDMSENHAPFQVLRYALSSLMDRVGPSAGPTVGDNADGGSTKCFVSDTVKDDDFP
nr:hypothetical protein CFP56_71149 [Quercus suber]